MAVTLDQPGAVVAVDEAGHGLAQRIDGVVQLAPQALVFEGADPALSAAMVSGSSRNAGLSAIPSQASEPVKWAERYCGPSRAEVQATGDVALQPSEAVDDRVIDRLEGGEPVADLGHMRPGSAVS